jgi:hypothetical protein
MNREGKHWQVYLFLFALITGSIWYYVHTFQVRIKEGQTDRLRAKFSSLRIDEHCPWSKYATYLSCFKKDFLASIRSGSPYERVVSFDILKNIFVQDYSRHTNETGRLASKIDYIDLLNNFILLSDSLVVARDNLQFIELILVYSRRSEIIDYFSKESTFFGDITTEQRNLLELDEELGKRFLIVQRENERVLTKIKDSLLQ